MFQDTAIEINRDYESTTLRSTSFSKSRAAACIKLTIPEEVSAYSPGSPSPAAVARATKVADFWDPRLVGRGVRLKVESDDAEVGLIRAAKPAFVRVQAYTSDSESGKQADDRRCVGGYRFRSQPCTKALMLKPNSLFQEPRNPCILLEVRHSAFSILLIQISGPI